MNRYKEKYNMKKIKTNTIKRLEKKTAPVTENINLRP